ncbi:MAG: diguanylate cyclase [Acidobacteriota bacterium]|nr:diguanylate cyclase [Acidobacteriota bacterium]
MTRRKKPKKETVLKTKSSSTKTARASQLEPKPAEEILQEHPEDAPAGWVEVQDKLAATVNLSLLLVDGRQPPAVVASNNNSICHAFQSSPEYVSLCDPYCGDAHRRAMAAGTMVQYKCHAGLQCFTMPVQIGRQQNLAAIGGRAFVSSADYRSLVDRFRAGELNELLNRQPFENVIFAEEQRLERLSERVDKAARTFETPVTAADDRVAVQPPAASVKHQLDEMLEAFSKDIAGDLIESVPAAQLKPATPDLQLEVDRLRGELEYRAKLADSLQKFLERISATNPDKTYEAILVHVRQLLSAERASLWVFDEDANEIILRAVAGFVIEGTEVARIRAGEGIAGKVIESGQPLVVENLETADPALPSSSRNYKTKSFISYPIILAGRRVGLLNVADKSGGESFNDVDLSLLEIVGPQIAVALERAEWQERAAQFQLMSITDPLTGLLNRRYLEERLTEELNRSKRYNYAMSCLMIDIDDFKKYNDRNGHQAGDVALKITAHSLKAALRSADIACRYGGEEFCILLPQTTVSEAGVIAERMRQRVAEADYPYGKSQPMGKVSISIGISTFGRHIDTAESVISAADRALYTAKSQGKNRIEFYVDNLTSTSSNPANK